MKQFTAEVEQIMAEAAELLIKKQHDYGPGNIARFGLKGVTVRMNDKIERLINLTWDNLEPKNESVHDTLIDLLNYACIGIILLRGQWPEVQNRG